VACTTQETFAIPQDQSTTGASKLANQWKQNHFALDTTHKLPLLSIHYTFLLLLLLLLHPYNLPKMFSLPRSLLMWHAMVVAVIVGLYFIDCKMESVFLFVALMMNDIIEMYLLYKNTNRINMLRAEAAERRERSNIFYSKCRRIRKQLEINASGVRYLDPNDDPAVLAQRSFMYKRYSRPLFLAHMRRLREMRQNEANEVEGEVFYDCNAETETETALEPRPEHVFHDAVQFLPAQQLRRGEPTNEQNERAAMDVPLRRSARLLAMTTSNSASGSADTMPRHSRSQNSVRTTRYLRKQATNVAANSRNVATAGTRRREYSQNASPTTGLRRSPRLRAMYSGSERLS
jgi:hypothetical protein